MAQITAALVKELREITGAGMMDCKKALVECEGDKDKAIDYLREKGIAKAAKKAGRIASEGVVAAAVTADGKTACIVEINSETDFVAKNENFQNLVKKIAEHIVACKPADMDALNASQMDGKTVAEVMTEAVASIGEKLSLRRFEVYTTEDGQLATYIHMGGKIGVLVELGCDKADAPELAEAAHMVCLQIAANAPKYIKPEDVPQAEIDAELEIKLNALKEQKGKLPPEQALVGIKKGMAAKFCTQICLLKQDYVADGDLSVEKYLDGVAKTIGAPITVKRFVRLQLGA